MVGKRQPRTAAGARASRGCHRNDGGNRLMAATGLVDSRLGPGTLTIATNDYSYQIANVALEPDISDEDGTPTLAEPAPAPLATVAWNLTGTAIQDFGAGPTSFLNYLMDHALEEVAFDWTPDTAE